MCSVFSVHGKCKLLLRSHARALPLASYAQCVFYIVCALPTREGSRLGSRAPQQVCIILAGGVAIINYLNILMQSKYIDEFLRV